MTVQAEMIGKYVGDYQITQLLGEGGMGVVYKGVHPTLGQVVAIKMLHPNLVKAESIKQRFLREAQAMARLRHQNILQLFNFIDSADGCFIVMEFVEGKTFETILEEQGLIPCERAIELFLPVLSAMSYAHQNGIIHRDIKPSNIMLLNGTNTVKVMDFGTAKMAGGPQLTAAGMTLGTVVYMSPEQLMGRDLSPQADIYSLGVTLYEMTTGRLPFYHDNEMQLMKMIMKEPPPPPSVAYPAMPKSLERVILRSIEKDMAKRYKTTDEFARDLEAIRQELSRGAAGAPLSASGPIPAAVAAPVPAGVSTPAPMPPLVPPMPSGAQPPVPAAAPPPVEDTQSMARPAAVGAPVAPAAAGAKPGASPLVIVGAAVTGVGVAAGVPLAVAVHTIAGISVLAGLVVIGLVLLLVGIFAGGGAPSAAPVAASARAPQAGASAAARPPAPQEAQPSGSIKSPVTPIPASEKRVCPTCNRVLLPTMAGCPFCAPAPAKAPEESTAESKPAKVPTPPPGSFGVPGQTFIEITEGVNRGQRIELNGQPLTIGRAPDNSVVLKDAAVSSHHARIDFYQGKYFISDLKSSNGTYINNARIEQTQIKHKDQIIMGGSRMIVNLG